MGEPWWGDDSVPMEERQRRMCDAIESGTAELPVDALDQPEVVVTIIGAFKLLAEKRGAQYGEAYAIGQHLREELLVASEALEKHGAPYSANRAREAAHGERFDEWRALGENTADTGGQHGDE